MARVVVVDCPHHVTQRRNRRSTIFKDEEDRKVYPTILKKSVETHELDIWAYCLMTNHVHFVAVPRFPISLSGTFRDAHAVYAQRFNSEWGHSGYLGRFFSCPMDDLYMWSTVRYVERNPVRAGLVERAEDYRWSSTAAHCGLRDDLLSEGFPPDGVIPDWSRWLREEDDNQIVKTIRKHTHTGLPCGGTQFVDHLEKMLGRSLRPKKKGRKPKSRN